MAILSGKDGYVTFSTHVTSSLEVTSWSLDVSCNTSEVAYMSATDNWVANIANSKNWSASVECAYKVPLAAIGASATLTLALVSGTDFEGTAICNSLSYSVDANNNVTTTVGFVGNGAVA